MSLIERTLVLLKPDAVQRSLVGTIVTRFENAGLKIRSKKSSIYSRFYRNHRYKGLSFLPIFNLPSYFVFFKQTKVFCLDMGNFTQIFYRSVKHPIFHPGFARALFTESF